MKKQEEEGKSGQRDRVTVSAHDILSTTFCCGTLSPKAEGGRAQGWSPKDAARILSASAILRHASCIHWRAAGIALISLIVWTLLRPG
jgi:hypothetical protein